jgi:hypothetical protein
MTYSVKTIYPEFKNLTAHKKVMKRFETAMKVYIKDQDCYMECYKKSTRIWFRLLRIKVNDIKGKRDEALERAYKSSPLSTEFLRIKSYAINEIRKYSYSMYCYGVRKELFEEKKNEWIVATHRLKKKYPYLYEEQIETRKGCYDYGGYKSLDEMDAWRKYKRQKMMDYARQGEFYEAMLVRDKVLGMNKSLPDEIIGEIMSYL